MNHYQKVIAVLAVAVLGLWGCAQKPATAVDKIRGLEHKVVRLEEDFRAATAARDQLRKKLADAEAVSLQLRQEIESLQGVIKERDELRAQLKARTAERDNLAQQFDSIRKSLKDLLGQTEAALNKPGAPVITPVSQPKLPNL